MVDKIYLVTSGCYSDYSVSAAFTDRAQAEAAVARHRGGDRYGSYDIEEFLLNPDVLSTGMLAWRVEMEYGSGDRAKAGQMDFDGALEVIGKVATGEVFDRYEKPVRRIFWCECEANDETHAIKIANERRAMYKAMKGENDVRDV